MSEPARVEELRERLRQLEAARGVMSTEALERLIGETEAELRRLEESGTDEGTPEPGGEVEPRAGRRSVAIAGDADRVVIVTGDGNRVLASEADPELLFDAYLSALARECGRLPLGTIDTRFAPGAADGQVKLPEVYVDLDVTSPPRPDEEEGREWAWRLVRGDAGGRTPLTEALCHADRRRHVLLGDPGSGKTTFASYLGHALAVGDEALPEAWAGLVPVRFVLREVAAGHLPAGARRGTAEVLWSALEAGVRECLGGEGARRLFPHLQRRILESGAFVVLDGLDEVPEAKERRRVLLDAVAAFDAALVHPGSRFLVTARPYAYADPRWHLQGYEILALAPFDQRQVEGFLDRWYLTAARRIFSWNRSTARGRAQELRAALQLRPYLGDLATRPLLLTLMATLHSSWGQLPEDRADLYEESVKLLLGRWQRAREVITAEGERQREESISQLLAVPEFRLRGVLEELAFGIHERQGADPERGEEPADVSRGELLEAFEPLLGQVAPADLFSYLEDRAGLLINRREGVWAFPHRSFQEYLAACYLGSLPEPGEEIRKLAFGDPLWWREVVLLAINRTRRGGVGNAVSLVTVLQPEGPPEGGDASAEDWRVAVLCAQAILELRLAEAALERPHYTKVIDRAREWLRRLVEGGHLPAKERLEAGDLLGRLGDPRPGVGLLSGETDEKSLPGVSWVEIPAGTFTMGSPEDDDLAWDDERPPHPVELDRFWIARYPITNAQFRPFVDGDGYSNRSYWTGAGWRWRHGELEPDLSIYSEEMRERISEWLAQRTVDKRDRPFFWGDPRWGAATRPVVGITWYEAWAYARWLEARYREVGKVPGLPGIAAEGVQLRLPTEAQWERAARGDADTRRWPWKGSFEDGSCNSSELELNETSPVGIFPAGVSPGGVADLAGNVWEWTTTILDLEKHPYPYKTQDGREETEGSEPRVIRGGSFYQDKKLARCSVRVRGVPVFFDDFAGFRVVLSLADSDF